MKKIALALCVTLVLYGPSFAKAEKSAAPVNIKDAFSALKVCAALKDRSAYDQKKVDAYAILVPGLNGWLFRSSSDFRMNFEFDEARIEQLARFQRILESKGTRLYTGYLPNRGILAAENIPPGEPMAQGFDAAMAKTSYDTLTAKMREKGLRIVTLKETLKAETFFRKMDQHWNTSGARIFANAVAQEIKADPTYSALRKTPFESVSKGSYAFEGRFTEATEKLCGAKLPLEEDEEVLTSAKTGEGGAGLLGESPAPEIVLVGTSNSKANDFNANFDGFLKEFLQADVLNVAEPGAGIDMPMIAYLHSKEFHDSPPKFLIWEIPGYYIFSENKGKFLDELLPSALGDCDAPVHAFSDVKLDGAAKTLPLITNLAGKKLQGATHYIRLEFSAPPEKDFTVFFNYIDSDKARYKFKRSKRLQPDTLYGVIVPDKEAEGKGKATLASIDIAPNEKMKDMTVSGKLCPLP